MSEVLQPIRLGKAAKELNIGAASIVEHLQENGFEIENKPTTKLSPEMYAVLLRDFQKDKAIADRAKKMDLPGTQKRENVELKPKDALKSSKPEDTEEVFVQGMTAKPEAKKAETEEEVVKTETPKLEGTKVTGKIDLDKKAEPETPPEPVEEPPAEAEVKPKKEAAPDEHIETKFEKLSGPKVVGKIELPKEQQKKDKGELVASSSQEGADKRKRRRKRITRKDGGDTSRDSGTRKRIGKADDKQEISEKEIEDKIKATMAKLEAGKSKTQRSKLRRDKRDRHAEQDEMNDVDSNVLHVTEFISVSELANLMEASVPEIIGKCMNLGIIVSINQRLDAEVIELLASEYDYEVKFISVTEQSDEVVVEEKDNPEDLKDRPPIVTIMGHVDHGKTSLLDYIRRANVIAGEMGGITQHIGAYEVTLDDGKAITFLDTPGHEAFTAMRARGAKITDIAVIVVAADDDVMPQTKEAISHAQAAGVPMVFAINKIDKENANPERIKQQLAEMNLQVEDWGGKYQSQDISAKSGQHVEELLTKILLEAELLELKANPDKNAIGSVIEASLDKGRGYVTTVLVQAGTLKIGDMILAGSNYGKVKAMTDERGKRVKIAGPSTPVQVLGMNGAPPAGEKFKVYNNEQEVKTLATKREQIEREQGMRATKHITLDEIGRRLALGNFKELNVIVKGDVDGSIEALSDSLQKLSTEEIQVNIIHKAVGAITESDVMLASASDAIIIGFQVRPTGNARKIAENENIEIRLYSIIYDAIEELKSAMEGMLEPTVEEKITGNIEVREIFKISRVGTVAGSYVTEGKITRNNRVRLIRDGIVIYTGEIDALKRFKDDVKEVKSGMECGVTIKNYNDIKVGDMIEGFEEVKIKRTL